MNWHCRHPEAMSEASFIKTTGHSANEVLQIYKDQGMKGSNLVVGLGFSSAELQHQDIPPAFFRTLAYMFELAKSGRHYEPVSREDLERGAPDPAWCPPLWVSPGSGSGTHADTRTPGTGTADGVPAQLAASLLSPPRSTEALLSCAPFWCYLYSHMASRAKKTPPKTSEQMLQMLASGSLPDWTPLLGLTAEVATFNSLPPALFMTFGSLVASGAPYRAVGVAELEQWDKFIDSRSSTGATQAGVTSHPQQQAQLGAGSSGTPPLPSPQRASSSPGVDAHMGGGGGSAVYYPPPPGMAPPPPPHGPPVSVGGYGMAYHAQGAAMSPFHHPAMTQHHGYPTHAGAWSPVWVGGYAAPPGGHAHGHGYSAQPMYGQPQPPQSPPLGHGHVQHHPGHGMHAHHPWAAPTRLHVEYHAPAAMYHHGGAPPPASPGYESHDHHGGNRSSAPTDLGGGAAQRGSPPVRVFRTQLSAPARINQPAAPRHRLSGSGPPVTPLPGVAEGSSISDARARQRHSTGQQPHQQSASPSSPLAARHSTGQQHQHGIPRSPLAARHDSGSEAATPQRPQETLPLPLPVQVACGQPMARVPTRWGTSIFRLFTADATRGSGSPAWWHLTPGDTADASPCMEGPYSCEDMILAFAGGALGSDHYVCGAKAESASPHPGAAPPMEMFERLGDVLERVEDSREYELVEM
ncbi:hypothetical protein FOA52_015440 [Chlamydomonas sp. UWO 241]|nr:hypothetical protein FOA52_015440 [Chlamydomonas sp. UWO 241]